MRATHAHYFLSPHDTHTCMHSSTFEIVCSYKGLFCTCIVIMNTNWVFPLMLLMFLSFMLWSCAYGINSIMSKWLVGRVYLSTPLRSREFEHITQPHENWYHSLVEVRKTILWRSFVWQNLLQPCGPNRWNHYKSKCKLDGQVMDVIMMTPSIEMLLE